MTDNNTSTSTELMVIPKSKFTRNQKIGASVIGAGVLIAGITAAIFMSNDNEQEQAQEPEQAPVQIQAPEPEPEPEHSFETTMVRGTFLNSATGNRINPNTIQVCTDAGPTDIHMNLKVTGISNDPNNRTPMPYNVKITGDSLYGTTNEEALRVAFNRIDTLHPNLNITFPTHPQVISDALEQVEDLREIMRRECSDFTNQTNSHYVATGISGRPVDINGEINADIATQECDVNGPGGVFHEISIHSYRKDGNNMSSHIFSKQISGDDLYEKTDKTVLKDVFAEFDVPYPENTPTVTQAGLDSIMNFRTTTKNICSKFTHGLIEPITPGQ